jgi:hypothetical protein
VFGSIFRGNPLFQLGDDQLARGKAVLAVQLLGEDQRGFRQVAQIVLVGGERHARFRSSTLMERRLWRGRPRSR